MNTIPLRMIIGPLGAGKTSLLRQLLAHRTDDAVHGVLVNDFGHVEIDKHRLQDGQLLIAALQGGCVCCSLQASVQQALEALITAGATQLWLEPSGIADVRALYLTLRRLPFIRLLPIVAVLPAASLLADRHSSLLRAQLALAHYVFVSHAHALNMAQQKKISDLFAALYPAKLDWVVDVERQDVPRAWLQELSLAVQPRALPVSSPSKAADPLHLPVSIVSDKPVHGLMQSGWVYPDTWQWSRPCLVKAFAAQTMDAVKRIKGVLRTGPQHWYQVDWTMHGSWQWQESAYAGESRLEVLYTKAAIDWESILERCRHSK